MQIEHNAKLTLTLSDDEVHVFYDLLKAATAWEKPNNTNTSRRVVAFCNEALHAIFPSKDTG